MLQFEEHSKNSPEEIAAKTGIDENRIKDIYFRRGSPEAYELILIEKVIGKNLGSSLMRMIVRMGLGKFEMKTPFIVAVTIT